MTEAEAGFVESMGQFLASFGMTPMAGRLWAWLLICEPAEQTAAELAEDMKASRGAISGAAAALASAGMIRRRRKRGERREFFSAPPGTFDALLRSAGAVYGQLAAITEEGLAALGDRPRESRARLEEVHDAVEFVRGTLPGLMAQYLAERDRRRAAASDPRTAPGPVGAQA